MKRALRALRSPWSWILIGTLLRLLHILTLGNRYYFGDTVEYEAAALRILHGMGLEGSSPRAPLYPLFMALSFWIGGEGNFVVTRLLKLGLAIGLMVVVTRAAGRLGGRPAATLAAMGIAFAPTIVFVSGLLYPTTLYMLLLATLTLVTWDLGEHPDGRRGALFGLLLGLGWLTDQVVLAPVSAMALWLLYRMRDTGAAMARALAIGSIVAAIVVLPYMMSLQHGRSDRVFMRKAQSVLHSARTDSVLAQERWVHFAPGTPFVPKSPQGFARQEGLLFVRQPVGYLHDLAWEFLHFFRPVPDRIQSENRFTQPAVLYVGGIYFLALLTLAILGLGFGQGPRRGRILLSAIVLATAGFYSFFFTQARYRVPIEPQLIILAALGVQRAFPRLTAMLLGSDSGAEAEPS